MSAKELKISIEKLLQQVNDPVVLEAYYEILKNLLKVQKSQIIGYDSDGEPISMESLDHGVDAAIKRIKSGQSISTEDFKK